MEEEFHLETPKKRHCGEDVSSATMHLSDAESGPKKTLPRPVLEHVFAAPISPSKPRQAPSPSPSPSPASWLENSCQSLSDVLETAPPKRTKLEEEKSPLSAVPLIPPSNPDRLISPHKFKPLQLEARENYLQLLMRARILMAGDVLVCDGVRGRLTDKLQVVEEENPARIHKSVQSFVNHVGTNTDENLKWFHRVHILNVGLQSFSTRLGVCLAELFDLLVK